MKTSYDSMMETPFNIIEKDLEMMSMESNFLQ